MSTSVTRQWYQRPIRVIQTILRTCDAPGYDGGAFIDFALRNHANAVVINAGGLQAFYPTRVEGHPIVDGLEQDILGDVVERAHDADLKVLARVDFRAGSPAMFEESPEWFSRDEDGDPRTVRGLYTVPATSPYRGEAFAFPVIRELLEHYSLDGIWENAPAFVHATPGKRQRYDGPVIDSLARGEVAADFSLVDYSPSTVERFEADTGFSVPRPDAFDPEAYLTYISWRYDVVVNRTQVLRDLIKSYGHELAYIAETPAVLESSWSRNNAQDVSRLVALFDIVALPTFGITRGRYGSPMLPSTPWHPAEVAAHLRVAKPGTAPAIMFGRFDNVSRYTSVAPADLDLWLAGGLAQGAGSWECTFVGRSDEEFHDRRADAVVEAHYARTAELTPLLDDARSAAKVGVVHSSRAEALFSASEPSKDRYVDHVRGSVAALLGAHVPFDIVPDIRLTEVGDRYDVLVLPNLTVLDDDQVVFLREYVEGGGGLVATGTPGLRSASGARDALPLADLLGVVDSGRTIGPLHHAFGYLEDGQSPVAKDLGRTDMVTTEGSFRVVAAASGAEVPLSLIEEIAPQPPEWGWIDIEAAQRQPFVVLNRPGRGRTAYFPGQIDKHVASSGHPDHALLLTNAIRWAAGRPAPVTAEAPASVHVSPLRTADGERLVVSLVNYSSAPQRPITEVIPVRDVTVVVRWTALGEADGSGETEWRARDALTGEALRVVRTDDGLRIAVDEISAFRALVVEPVA